MIKICQKLVGTSVHWYKTLNSNRLYVLSCQIRRYLGTLLVPTVRRAYEHIVITTKSH